MADPDCETTCGELYPSEVARAGQSSSQVAVPIPRLFLGYVSPTRRTFQLCAAILFLLTRMHAQHFTLTNYGEGSGLTNLNATTLVQDHSGVVWAGTQNGLFDADGNRFEKNVEVSQNGFEDIRSMREDGAGRLWIVDGRHVGYWQAGTSRILNNLPLHVLSHETIDLLVVQGQRDGAYLLRSGEVLLISTTNSGATWRVAPALSPGLLASMPDLKTITSIASAGKSTLWVGCGKSICRVDLNNQTATKFDETEGVPHDQWIALEVTRSGHVWARGTKNIVRGVPTSARFEQVVGLPAGAFASLRHAFLLEDGGQRMIINLAHGIAVSSKSGWEVVDETNGLPEDEIDAMMLDRRGALWLTSLGHGVFRWRGYGEWEGWNKASGLQSNIIWNVGQGPTNDLWVATNTGLDRLDLSTRLVTQHLFPGQRLFSVRVDDRGHLWIADSTGSIMDYDPATRRTRIAALGLDRVFDLHIDQQKRVWACTRKGLLFFGPEDKWTKPVMIQDAAGPMGYAWSIAEARDGTIWVGAGKGIFRLKGTSWAPILLPFEGSNHANRSMAAASDGTLWVQDSLPYPVLHLAITGSTATILDRANAVQISSDNTTFVEIDRRGWVWVGSDDGVRVFNGHDWTQCTAEDGLLWDDTDFRAFLEDRDGSIWIGTSGGVAHLMHPERVFNHTAPEVRLSSLELGGRNLVGNKPILDLRRPTLIFRFQDINYDRGSAVVAQYRLEGEENEWHDTTSSLVRFPALEPGAYTLHVRAYDTRSGRSSEERDSSFTLLQPWWRRGWFLILESLAFTGMILALWRLSIAFLVSRQRQLTRLVAQRTEELEREKAELLHTRAALLEITRIDSLTGLLNRSTIFEQLDALRKGLIVPPRTMAIVMADLDLFKRINDGYGHPAGDSVLRECATRIKSATRNTDLVGRYGGEELLIIMPSLSLDDTARKTEEIRAAIASTPVMHDGRSISVTCSFGVAWFDNQEESIQELLASADEALYKAKRNGRNRVEFAPCSYGSHVRSIETLTLPHLASVHED